MLLADLPHEPCTISSPGLRRKNLAARPVTRLRREQQNETCAQSSALPGASVDGHHDLREPGGLHRHRDAQRCPSRGTSPSLSPASSPRPAARPGSPGNPLLLSCGEESFTEPPVPQQPQPGDLAIGPLFIVNGKRLATASPAGYGDHGSYKIPIIVTMGSTVTVTIAAPARGQVVIDNPYAHLAGVSDLAAATYRSCSHIAGFFAQGFTFTHGQTRGCVPLDVRIGHQPQVHHVMLSLFAGSCLS